MAGVPTSFTEYMMPKLPEDGRPLAPLPILPTLLQIGCLLCATAPHLDIVKDKVRIVTTEDSLEISLQYTALGSLLLFLGFYLTQFIKPMAPLRREYLGSLGLVQLVRAALLGARAWMYPTAAAADVWGSVIGYLMAMTMVPLFLYDGTAEIHGMGIVSLSEQVEKDTPQKRAAIQRAGEKAVQIIKIATHVMLALYAVSYNVSALASLLPPSALVKALGLQQGPYGNMAALLADGMAVFRLATFVKSRRQPKEEESKEKAE